MTTDKETLTALLERVRAATGPDRELDEQIALAICDEHEFAQLANAPVGTGCMMYRHGHSQMQSALRVTGSIDAALALTERLVGDHWFGVLLDAMREFGAAGTEPPSGLPRYILAATLSALIAQAQP